MSINQHFKENFFRLPSHHYRTMDYDGKIRGPKVLMVNARGNKFGKYMYTSGAIRLSTPLGPGKRSSTQEQN